MAQNSLDSILTKRHYTRLRHYFKSHRAGTMCDNLDLDLVGLGLVTRKESYGNITFVITDEGEKELYREKQREIARRSPHHDLGSRLSTYLRSKTKITWENIEFKIETFDKNGVRNLYVARPDVFSLNLTYNEEKISPTVYEVKVNRADFLTDLKKPEKRGAYQEICECMYYVCKEGLIKIEEVPIECGLIYEMADGTFKTVKRVKKKKVKISNSHFMNLIVKKGKFNSITGDE